MAGAVAPGANKLTVLLAQLATLAAVQNEAVLAGARCDLLALCLSAAPLLYVH